jgi:serine/threonine protein kinase
VGKFKIDPALEKTLTEACVDVLKQCLEVNPKSRITMEELADHPWLSRKI